MLINRSRTISNHKSSSNNKGHLLYSEEDRKRLRIIEKGIIQLQARFRGYKERKLLLLCYEEFSIVNERIMKEVNEEYRGNSKLKFEVEYVFENGIDYVCRLVFCLNSSGNPYSLFLETT